MKARCLSCGKIVLLDPLKAHVYPELTTPTGGYSIVDFSKIKEGEVVRGTTCLCLSSVDFQIVAQ